MKYLGIVAHFDDLELCCLPAIKQCYKNKDDQFYGLICTCNSDYHIRWKEQVKAAKFGKYEAVHSFSYDSSILKIDNQPKQELLKAQLLNSINTIKPDVIWTHNPFDKHRTHQIISNYVIEAVRNRDPYKLYGFFGGEVWRDLDWISDYRKKRFVIDGFEKKALKLIKYFKSQLNKGRRFDEAFLGRLRANATFGKSGQEDEARYVYHAMDLMPINSKSTKVNDYLKTFIDELKQDIFV